MHLSLPVVLLGLAATVTASTPKSYDQWVKEFPSCAQSCMDTWYDDTMADQCGKSAKSSTDPKDLKCVCSAKAKMSDLQDDSSNLQSCVAKKCANADQSDLEKVSNAANDLFKMCSSSLGGDSSSTSSPSSSSSVSSPSATSSSDSSSSDSSASKDSSSSSDSSDSSKSSDSSDSQDGAASGLSRNIAATVGTVGLLAMVLA